MTTERTPTNPSRRRLAKSGLAVPVVLASVTSKNAFGLPYQCFTSGKLSNNLSGFGPNPDQNNNPACKLDSNTSTATSALIGDQQKINDTFVGVSVFRRPNGRLVTTSGNQNVPATLHDVLVGQSATGENQSPVQNLPLLKKAVVVYFNAKGKTVISDAQPLTEAQTVQLINAVIANQGATFQTSVGRLDLTPAGVQQYFNQFVV